MTFIMNTHPTTPIHPVEIRADVASQAAGASVTACLGDIAALIGMWEQGYAFDLEADLPPVGCDPIGLRSAVLNLVFNARAAVAGNGTISIAARTIGRGPARVVALSVADDGIGMSSDTVARAFDPFFTTKSDGLGGFGLPMVEHFIGQAGGEIAVENAPGIGTIVTMRLPAVATPALHPILITNGEVL